jgi:hypothetical protein
MHRCNRHVRIRSHSRRTVSTSLLLRNRRLCKRCVSGPTNRGGCTTFTWSELCGVALCAVRSNPASDHLFGPRSSTVEPRFTNSPVHEQIFRAKTSRLTNGVSDYEHPSWQQRLVTSWEARRGSVSWWLTLAQYTSLLEFAVPALEFRCVSLIYY